MKYNKKSLQAEMDTLVGESIKNVYYYTEYEGYEVFNQLSNEIVEVPLLGMLLETSSGSLYNITSHDYPPYYGLEGLDIFRNESLITPQGRPNQFNTFFWNRFRNRKITKATIIENYYVKTGEVISIPFGFEIIFAGGEECYFMNLSIEDFIKEKGVYELCRGGDLVLFSGKDVFNKYSIMEENTFYI